MDAFCRVCMLRKTQKILLADSRNGAQILDMLASVCGIHFKESPQLPHWICERCLSKLELAHAVAQEFREQEMLRRNLWLADAWLVRLEEYQTMAREEPRSERLLKGLNASIAREKEICTSIPLENLENAAAETVLKEELIIEDDSNQDDATRDQEEGEEEPCSAQVPVTDSVLEEKIDETDQPCGSQENQPVEGLPEPDRIYHCNECKKKFKSLKVYINHLRRHEQIRQQPRLLSKEPKLSCVQCKREYSDVRGLQCHVAWHNRRGLLCCSTCGENQVSSEAMKNHICPNASKIAKMMKQRPTPPKYRCEECGKRFTNNKDYQIHRGKHENIRNETLKCDICFKTFSGKVKLRNHLREHNIVPKYRKNCEECGKELISFNAYRCHIYRHKQDRDGSYHCPKCAKSFSTTARLVNHTCSAQKPSKDGATLVGSETALRNEQTFSEVTVKEELSFDENSPPTVEQQSTAESGKRNVRKTLPKWMQNCEECGRKFANVNSYRCHMRRHRHVQSGKYRCAACGKCLTHQRQLMQHKCPAERESKNGKGLLKKQE